MIVPRALRAWLGLALLALGAACSGDRGESAQRKASATDLTDVNVIERGKYLAAIGNCSTCHTGKGASEYGGGVEFETPFGVIYSTNITPHTSAGIGAWGLEDFRRAMHEGIAPGGKHLYPAFPYTSFTQVSDEDVDAIFAFLRTLPPSDYVPPKNGLLLRVRWPLALWKQQFFVATRFTADPEHDATWNRGAYLVEGLGHCSACHTPRNLFMAEIAEEKYAGGTIRGEVAAGRVRDWSAVNLTTSKQGLGAWSAKDLAMYLRTGFSPRAGTFGPMNEVIIPSLKQLTVEDSNAMAAYIKSLPARDFEIEPVTLAMAGAGAEIYDQRCAKCHSESGRGGMFSGPPLAGSAVVQSVDPSSLINIVLYGQGDAPTIKFGAWEEMAAYAEILTDAEIADVSNFIRASWGNKASAVKAEDVKKQR